MLKNEKYSRDMYSIGYIHITKYKKISEYINSKEFNEYVEDVKYKDFHSVEEVMFERCIKLFYLEKSIYKNIVKYQQYEQIKNIMNEVIKETVFWMEDYKSFEL